MGAGEACQEQPGRIDKTDNRPAKLLRLLHQAQRLAVTVRVGHPEIALLVLFQGAPLLLPDHCHHNAIYPRNPAHNRPVIPADTVTVQFHKAVKNTGIEAEERGQGEAIARNLYEMSALKVPVLSIFIGEGGSGGALALAVANEVWMLENATYFILLKSPETIIALLYNLSRCFAVIGAQKLKDSLAQLTRYKFHIVAV